MGIKRLSWRVRGPIQLEAYLTFKPEATELVLSEADVRAVGVLFDIQDAEGRTYRWMPHLRYLNALEGDLVQRWQYKSKREPLQEIGGGGETRSHFHLAPTGWEDVPGGEQKLYYNEIATKMQWLYLKVEIDLRTCSFTGFRCSNRVYSAEGMDTMRIPAMPNLWCMLNVGFWVEAEVDKRAFLYVDSVLLSAELEL